MQKLSKLLFFLFVFLSLYTIYYIPHTPSVSAQVPGPVHKPPCGESKDPEFHSLRPYQAAPCGDAPKALFCSNDLIFIETFDFAHNGCGFQNATGDFPCNPGSAGQIKAHDLIVTLDDSMFPIMGNTEEVKNSQNSGDVYDDATKVNEYMSWYLSGVANKAESGIPTDDQIVNYSGPVNKLLPAMIQEAERIKTIESVTKTVKYKPDGEDKEIEEPENHNQIVVCAQEGIFGIWGKTEPKPCTQGDKYRLQSWEGDLSALRAALNLLNPIADAWNKRTPPLPWSDENGKPFKSDILYKKAYAEWQGKSCVILPVIGLQCIDNPLVVNKYSELYHYIPLSNNTDKSGAEYIAGDGPSYTAGSGTVIANDMHDDFKSAILYMAHTREVDDLARLLNSTYTPNECKEVNGKTECKPLESKFDLKTVERLPTKDNVPNEVACSSLKVRTNKGDNLFPGDPDELKVIGVRYDIIEVICHEEYKPRSGMCGNPPRPCPPLHTLECPAQVTIKISTGTKTTFVDKIFEKTIANSASTFRKIYPKVEPGAPVSCIADIPTVTDVTYTPEDQLQNGEWEFKVKDYPSDGGSSNRQVTEPQVAAMLTFPHIGSFYEYFLNGIQTALRPKGYGEQPINGICRDPSIFCGEMPDLPKATGSCILGGISPRVGNIPPELKKIVEAAAEIYKTPPNLILGVMYGEGIFNQPPYQKFEWTDENVKEWATCTPIPGCSPTGNDNFVGFDSNEFNNITKNQSFKDGMKKIDPKREIFSQCNLLDSIFAVAWNLHDSADGSPLFPVGAKCIGIPLNRGTNAAPNSCDWENHQYNSAIRISEFGTGWGQTSLGFFTCATLPNSCATGGSEAAQCDLDKIANDPNKIYDTCDYKDNSHNQCVFDVGHGN